MRLYERRASGSQEFTLRRKPLREEPLSFTETERGSHRTQENLQHRG